MKKDYLLSAIIFIILIALIILLTITIIQP
jgi:hypothetical protein